MATTAKSLTEAPHIAVFPAAGIGHLIPFLRLAAMLAARGCTVTVVTARPTVSTAESDQLSAFFAVHPHIKNVEFQLLPYRKSKYTNEDPFFRQFEAIDSSVHLLRPVLSSLAPSLSAIVADFVILGGITQIVADLSISVYTLITTSAGFFCLITNLPKLLEQHANATDGNGCVELPVVGQIPVSRIPPPMLNPNHFFAAGIALNASSLQKIKGILINTFTCFEPEAIEALNGSELAPILPVGPLQPLEIEEASHLPWLDEQAQGSVLFISFGSRTALSKDQMRELGAGLEQSGCSFLWVLKACKVDKDDNEEVEEILGEAFLARTRMKGMVVRGWVNQNLILAHPSVGGFVSHCGWNSVVEAARLGVPILAWPQHGDQMVNAQVVEKMGLGLWSEKWGWGEQTLVNRFEIAKKIKELMMDNNVRARVREIKENARLARDVNGSSGLMMHAMIDSLKKA